jgi:hypothetical protein
VAGQDPHDPVHFHKSTAGVRGVQIPEGTAKSTLPNLAASTNDLLFRRLQWDHHPIAGERIQLRQTSPNGARREEALTTNRGPGRSRLRLSRHLALLGNRPRGGPGAPVAPIVRVLLVNMRRLPLLRWRQRFHGLLAYHLSCGLVGVVVALAVRGCVLH